MNTEDTLYIIIKNIEALNVLERVVEEVKKRLLR